MERDTLVLDTLAIFRRRGWMSTCAGIDAAAIAARFHNSLVRLLTEACVLVREQTGLDLVALSGGVFQNALMLQQLSNSLEQLGFQVLTHRLGRPTTAASPWARWPWPRRGWRSRTAENMLSLGKRIFPKPAEIF